MSHVMIASVIVTRLDICNELCAHPNTMEISFFFYLLRLSVKKHSPVKSKSVQLFVCRSERIEAPAFGIAGGIQGFRHAVFAYCKKFGPKLV